MLALPISMPCFKSINFYQHSSKIKLFLQKMQNFLCGEGSAPKPLVPLAAGGFAPRPPGPETFPYCKFLATRLMFLLLLCYFV